MTIIVKPTRIGATKKIKLSAAKRVTLLFALAGLCVSALAGQRPLAEEPLTLERAVLFMRHGVRPPTKSAQSMAALSESAWPDDAAWGAAPGELTPHGAESIHRLGMDLRHFYSESGLLPQHGSIADQTLIWADGADQRTRATGQQLALGLAMPDQTTPITISWSDKEVDPLFDGLNSGMCSLDPVKAEQAVLDYAPLVTTETTAALSRLQQIMAPEACQHGAGQCLQGPTKLNATPTEVKLTGPLATGATVSEVLLLEYENALPLSQVGWGRASRADIASLMLIHEHTSTLTRRTSYIATRRADSLVRFILAALSDASVTSTTPHIDSQQRLIVLTGHDTNLSNLAGVFQMHWQLSDQPDSTAPGTAIAFERWKNNATGKVIVRLRLFYQTMDQVRDLSATPVHQIALMPAACQRQNNPDQCELTALIADTEQLLPKDCKK